MDDDADHVRYQLDRNWRAVERRVRAWILDAQPPFNVGHPYQLRVQIDPILPQLSPTTGLQKAQQFEQRKLIVALEGGGVTITPSWQPITLQPKDVTDPCHFSVMPERAGKLHLYLSFSLAHELVLLEAFRTAIEAKEITSSSP